MAEHYELARRLNVLERVHFDLKEERFERSSLTETYDIGLLLTVFYHVMDDLPAREAFLRKLDQSVTGVLFWESGAEPEKEKAILLRGRILTDMRNWGYRRDREEKRIWCFSEIIIQIQRYMNGTSSIRKVFSFILD